MKRSVSGKNYNYAYDNLLKSWSSGTKELSRLAEMGEIELTETLGEFEFTSSCLKRLENMITQLEEIDDSRGFNRDEAMSRSEMQRKMTWFLLERTRQDFGFIYANIKSDLTEIARGRVAEFEELLSKSPWMVGALAEIGKELSIEALSEKNFEMFSLIASKDPNFSQYKPELLKTVLSEKNLGTLKFLLVDMYSPGEVSSVLGSKEYYASSREIIEEITKFLSDNPSAVSYKAMFLYSQGIYPEAGVLFEGVHGEGREKQIAQYYKGLCFQYSGDSKGATGAFESVIKSDTDGCYDKTSSIKQHAQQHLDSLKGEKTPVEKLAVTWKEIANSYLKKYEAVISAALSKVCASLPPSSPNEPGVISGTSVVQSPSPSKLAAAVEEAKKVLSKIKFINLKQDAPPEIVSAQEFRDLPKIYSSLVSKLDKAELGKYCAAVEQIEDAIKVVGETVAGFDVLEA
jgi:hypothetical protein